MEVLRLSRIHGDRIIDQRPVAEEIEKLNPEEEIDSHPFAKGRWS